MNLQAVQGTPTHFLRGDEGEKFLYRKELTADPFIRDPQTEVSKSGFISSNGRVRFGFPNKRTICIRARLILQQDGTCSKDTPKPTKCRLSLSQSEHL